MEGRGLDDLPESVDLGEGLSLRDSVLASGAVMGAAASDDEASNWCSTDHAGFAGPHVDAVLELKESPDTGCVDVVGHRRTAERDGRAQDCLQTGVQAGQLGTGEAGSAPAGTDAGPEEALIGIDIADPMEEGLVEEGCLDGGLPTTEEILKRGQADVQWLKAGSCEVGRLGGGLLFNSRFWRMQAHAAEAAGVHEAKLATGTEGEDAVRMGRLRDIGF